MAMAAQHQGARYRHYKRLLMDIATRLGENDIQALVVIQDLPEELKSASGVEVLRKLERGGLFSDRKIGSLAELLRGIDRHDLVNNYVQEYSQKFCSGGDSEDVEVSGTVSPSPMYLDCNDSETDCPRPPPAVSVSYSDLQQLIALVPHQKLQNATFSRDLKELINKLAGVEQKDEEEPKVTNPCHARVEYSRMPQQQADGSYTSSSEEFHKGLATQRSKSVGDVDHREGKPLEKNISASAEALVGADRRLKFQHQAREKRTSLDSSLICQRPQKAHSFSCETPVADMRPTTLQGQHGNPPIEQRGATKRSRIPSFILGSKGQKGDTALKDAMTISWKEKRGNFVGPIFFHRNKCFQKRVKVSAGSGPTRLNLNVNFKLFPNGINWDQDSYSTLKIEVTSPYSQMISSDAHLQLSVTGSDPDTGNIITARQVEWSLHEKAHIMKEFLAHEIVKVSSAAYFEFQATLRVKFSLSKDWVVVDTVSSMPCI